MKIDVVRRVVHIVATLRGVRPDELMSKSREPHIVQVRQLAMWACVKVLGVSNASTARRLGGRDHSTCLYAVKAIEERIQLRPGYRELTDQLRTILQAETLAARTVAEAARAMEVATSLRLRESYLAKSVERSASRMGTYTETDLQGFNDAFARAMREAGHV